ncbi:hypothetical protein MPTK1_2g10850 [Marchantia polymorpha subsp. ruderalis]|nr:hypothetical protein Mp_2g10850 [Marchantia polymorpha subsp. ruderalis]
MEIQGNVDFEKGILSWGCRCLKTLSCGKHECQQKCHPRPCGECEVSAAMLQTCPLWKEEIAGTRRIWANKEQLYGSCLDLWIAL